MYYKQKHIGILAVIRNEYTFGKKSPQQKFGYNSSTWRWLAQILFMPGTSAIAQIKGFCVSLQYHFDTKPLIQSQLQKKLS